MTEAEKRRDAYLRRTWGISLEVFGRILGLQGGGCAGCGRRGVTRSLHVEHDHATGFLRGICCAACNSALKKMRDDPQVAYNLANYLANPPAEAVVGQLVAPNPPKRRRSRRRR